MAVMKSLSVPQKLVGFAVGLAVVLAVSFGVARAVSPEGLADRPSGGDHGAMDTGEVKGSGGGHGDGDGGHGGGGHTGGALPGLAVAQDGYRFVAEATTVVAGPAQPFRFRIVGPDGKPVRRYEPLHERELHLIVVRRDLTGFQHVHPTRSQDGTWAIPLDLRAAGTWRAFADFSPAGGPGQLTLGVDLHVGGAFEVGTGPTAAAEPDPRFDVRFYRRGDDVEITVRRDGVPIEPERYLGARGHLVALRAGDLAYLHVHPEDGGGPSVRFKAELPTPGAYAMYFDYQVDGVVRTATITVEVHDGHVGH